MNTDIINEQNRFRELANRSYTNGQFLFTDFLSLAEQSAYYGIERELLFSAPVLNGGCEMSERRMIRFGDPGELRYEQDFPITALVIEPAAARFADDLTHRDFLGALMNLGIRRELLGDIYVKENRACVFCKDSISDYIIDNLTRIKHTTVKLRKTDDTDDITAPVLEDKIIQVASLRADAVVSRVYNLSRNDSVSMFRAGLIYVNGRECTENALTIRPGDRVSVRGYGKFEYAEETGISKKGKINGKVRIYK